MPVVFCIIPNIRGRLKSRSIESVVKEITVLVEGGTKEITLIAQDLTLYGTDSENKKSKQLELLQQLDKIPGQFWVRILYNYPENITDDLIDFLAQSRVVVPYLDIPFQHGSDRILKAMRRRTSRSQIRELIQKLRSRVDGIAIRTSVIVGFPGETEEDFQELCAMISESKIDHLGCFTYSKEEGTYAALLPGDVEQSVKELRRHKVMSLQKEIVQQINQRYVGTIQPVLVLGPSSETELLLEGRMKTQAPDVDGVVLINKGMAEVGEIVSVRITECLDYDLVGEIIQPETDNTRSQGVRSFQDSNHPI